MSLGEAVKKLREAKGVSQQALADEIGVTQTFVSKLEKGDRARLGADVYLNLCDALGVDCNHFRKFLGSLGAEAKSAASVKPPKSSKAKK
ncbi:helix-turn-helix domain-containing protein [Limnoglobus roseus]|uniref:XRE family transcriptional regulator n=1 Tax=Limnoglobus roseus TaxID=2598579 RepID=A0A5C1A7S7_9BACT|nr:helix-turn-helix transcriptional regulator [Limnoglobus roseus]QEL14046.1 XRE family transcriptional regulator [Limnoglobus roseus]